MRRNADKKRKVKEVDNSYDSYADTYAAPTWKLSSRKSFHKTYFDDRAVLARINEWQHKFELESEKTKLRLNFIDRFYQPVKTEYVMKWNCKEDIFILCSNIQKNHFGFSAIDKIFKPK